MECLLGCGEPAETGSLCRGCAAQVKTPDGTITEHVWSNAPTAEADAWLIDGFGVPHAIGARLAIGRERERDLVILNNSVSRGHAELRRSDGNWILRDTSHNGTFVDGVRAQGRVTLPARAIVRFGDMAFWFCSEVRQPPAATSAADTETLSNIQVDYAIELPDGLIRVVGERDTSTGGTLMICRPDAEDEDERRREHAVPPCEFQLLRTLCARAYAERESPAVARGFVTTSYLILHLPWRTGYPTDENVRQVVSRLRKALQKAGVVGDIVRAQAGRGYYVACPVTI